MITLTSTTAGWIITKPESDGSQLGLAEQIVSSLAQSHCGRDSDRSCRVRLMGEHRKKEIKLVMSVAKD